MVAPSDARLDVWVSSRDEIQARLFLQMARKWARLLGYAAEDLGQVVVEPKEKLSAACLRFANGLCIYALSSNPDAIAGKTGHLIFDEFALHKQQRELFAIGKPAAQWGGRIIIISTHRGRGTVFNQLLKDAREKGNPMRWSIHKVTLRDAVEDGIVEKINAASGRSETREEFLGRCRAECLDEEQWLQEYCCIPADDAAAFLPYELITSAETPGVLRDWDYLRDCQNPLYAGMDVARKKDLTVIDIGEKIGDVMWDRMRIEMRATPFAEQRSVLYRALGLRKMVRCCMDATGLGAQLAEEAKRDFGYKAEPVVFTAPVKESLAFPLRSAFEDRVLRIDCARELADDLRGIRKETTTAGNIRFVGDSDDSHCDRFWAKALRQHAAGFVAAPGPITPFLSSPRARACDFARRECPL
jgi:phage FluMu gp28-like protein